jgi:hypothetical protein
VPPHVRLEVARLGVHLAAAVEHAREDLVVVFGVRLRGRVFPARTKKSSETTF